MAEGFPKGDGEGDSGEVKGLILQQTGFTVLNDGHTELDVQAVTMGGLEVGEAKELIAGHLEVGVGDVEVVAVDDEPYTDKTFNPRNKRGSVAFSANRWKSPWDPHADKKSKGDPSQN